MRRLFALILVFTLWLGFAPSASADVAGLTKCSDTPAFQQRAKTARPTTADPDSGAKRFERYGQALCGPEGLPHLIVDGRLSHAGDFLLPSIMFLYITGTIGWAGRSYLIAVRKGKDAAMSEIILNLPLAFSCTVAAGLWPLLALKEFTSGEMFAKDGEITVSPR
ncbi:Photosystem I reaction center subunit III [Altericista sp. CCNU0014]|uniref:Photosystem I reaction center subunit III n=1 Tax=Altericista sp. CCNU0014 TaxID=3082949 RepID=UPI00384CE443